MSFHPTRSHPACIGVTKLSSRWRVFSRVIQWAGPLLFCLTIQQIVSKLQSELVLFYLDNGTIAASLQDVLADLRLIELEASKLGLELNHSKSELICDQPSVQESMLLEVLGLRTIAAVRQLSLVPLSVI